MKLSMSMLYSYLSEYPMEKLIHNDTMSIKGVRFISESSMRNSSDYVYIGAANGFFQDPEFADALILANGKNHIVCRGADTEDLLNDVLSAFEHYNNAEQDLFAASAEHRSISDMIPIIGKFLPYCLMVFSLDGTLIGLSNPEKRTEDPVADEIITKGNIGTITLGNAFVDKHGIESHDLSDRAQHMFIRGRSEGCVAMYIMQEGERVGFLLYFPPQDGIQVGMRLVPFIAEHIAKAAEFTASGMEYQSLKSILHDLIQGVTLPESTVTRLTEQIGLKEKLCLILVKNLTIMNHTSRTVLVNEMNSDAAGAIGCEIGDLVAIMTEERRVKGIIRAIHRKIPQENVSIGVSLPMPGPRDSEHMYIQAKFALDAIKSSGLSYCKDLALSYLLGLIVKDPVAAELLHPAIPALKQLDEINGTQFLETLNAYISTGCNQTESAKKLNIHLNTLKYRLKRISEITGVNFDDPRERLYLQISLNTLV